MLPFIRIWLPAVVTLAGVIVMAVGGFDDIALEGGAGIVGAGLSIWLMNVMLRIGFNDGDDRDREDAARDFYGEHGYWPDEAPPPGRAAREPTAAEPAPLPPGRRGPASAARFPPRRPR